MTYVAKGETGGAEIVQGLVDDVLDETFDESQRERALRWLTRRHSQMCARSGCFRKALSLGNTAAGVSDYPLEQQVIEILEVTVGGYVYGQARHEDIANSTLGRLWLSGGVGGVATRTDSAAGAESISLIPAPTAGTAPEPGSAISVLAVCYPPALQLNDDTTLKIPQDYYEALIAGAKATGLLNVEHRGDQAGPHEQIFAAACKELEGHVNRKYHGTGPTMIRLATNFA